MLKITRKTFHLYSQAVEKFEKWAKTHNRSLSSHRQADEAMCVYLHQMCEAGEPLTYGNYAVFGWIKLRSRVHLDSRQHRCHSLATL